MSQVSSFGQWLRQRRKTLDLTQEQLADRLGCSPNTIRKIELGTRKPSRQIAELLAQCLNVPTDQYEALVQFARGGPSTQDAAQLLRLALSPHPTNLPTPLTTFVGREEDIAAIKGLLLSKSVRLLTLTGPPGIGKTRLAVQTATESVDKFKDGVFFVALAPVSDPDAVPDAIAKSLGVKEAITGGLLDSLVQHLRTKHLLMLLDNFEQVMEAAPFVGQLLKLCPHLSVLTTSREALHLHGEQQFAVPPLALPATDLHRDPEALAHIPAIELFVQRAQAVKFDFSLTTENADVVANICTRLEGLPLAIELAAARVKLLSLQEIASWLDSSFKLLAGGPRDWPLRQQTLWGAISWSYDLLNNEEQKLFRRLGVFVGGCTLPAVEAICNARDDLGVEVLDGIASLIDKSLLKPELAESQEPEGTGESRFWMLEMIREYALERLEESGEADELGRLHAEYHLVLAEAAEPELRSAGLEVSIAHLEREHDNIRAALSWTLEHHEIETGARLATSLMRFWEMHSHWREANRWIDRVLEHRSELPPPLLAKVLFTAGEWKWTRSDPNHARLFWDEAVALWRELGDEAGVLRTLLRLAGIAHTQANLDQAQSFYEESANLAQRMGDQASFSEALSGLGWVAHDRCDYPLATNLFEQSLVIERERGDTHDIAARLDNLGIVALHAGDVARAQPLFEQSLAIQRRLDDKNCMARSLRGLGGVALAQGDFAMAWQFFVEALPLSVELDDNRSIAYCLEGLAGVAAVHQQAERAARMFGAAEALREAGDTPLLPGERVLYDQHLAMLRSVLPSEKFQAAWKVGRAMATKQAIEFALDNSQRVASTIPVNI
jgi:predicted ATPase/DNA-binding XRE family transcriptional regulator